MEVFDLSIKPQERVAVIHLMETEFPKGELQNEPRSFSDEFAGLLADNAPDKILFCAESLQDSRPLAALGWKSFVLKQELKVAALGLVVTDSKHRKKGLSRRLINEAESRARAEGCAVMCLWSDLLEFYTKLGYTLAGSEIGWDLGAEAQLEALGQTLNELSTVKAEIREARFDDLPQLLKLYQNDPVGPERTLSIFERQMRQAHSILLVAIENHEPVAYAIAGKGRDLRNVVHEISGDTRFYAPLLAEMRTRLTKTSQLPVRFQFPYSHASLDVFEELFEEGEQGAVCFAKVLDIDAFIAAINKEFEVQQLKELKLRYMSDINAWALADKKQDIFMSPDPSHLIQIFCHPWNLEELEGLPGRTLKRLEGWQPYPLYFWGADGV